MAKAKKPQISLPGRVLRGSKITDAPISINLDDADREGGRPISFELFQKMVNDYNNQPGITKNPETKVAYVIDKQLLQVLLSSRDCLGLMLCKCMRKDEKDKLVESIAFMAVGPKGPIGTTRNARTGKTVLADSKSEVPAGEWIHGLTVADELKRGIISTTPISGNGFDFSKFFDTLSKQAEKVL